MTRAFTESLEEKKVQRSEENCITSFGHKGISKLLSDGPECHDFN